MAKPTEAQEMYLKNRGIEPPPTKYACSLMIDYLKKGNNTYGDTEAERISITRGLQKKWLHQRVRTANRYSDKGEGVVDYLVAREPWEQEMEDEEGNGWRLVPYKARVTFDPDIGKYRKRDVGFYFLELIE